MNITRKAVLVGDSGSPSNFLAGVEVDIRNYRDYLKSPIGGSWKDHEIELLIGKSGTEVRNFISSLYNDYIFVAYSGHGGFRRSTASTVIELNGVDYDESILINSRCAWQLNVLDTCRSIIKEQPLMKGFSALNEAIGGVTSDTSAFFFNAFDDLEKGLMKIYSAGIGEAANEEPNEGGLYTYNELKISMEYGKTNNLGSYANINEVFNATKTVVQQKSNNRQNPEFLAGRRRYFPPFAMGIKTRTIYG